jgi:predicted ATPase
MSVHNLPSQPTPFIGREDELAEITKLLATPACRLLTLTGPGGIGKTHLAVEAARIVSNSSLDVSGRDRGEVYFISLQPLTSTDFIVPTIAEGVHFQFYPGGEPKQQLLDYLRAKSLLLVMDNFEHLLDGVGIVSEILAYAADVKVLATSRERLNLMEEWVLDIGGLSYPASDNETDVEGYSAVELFLQHAGRMKVSLALDARQKPAVTRICRLVGGMPLGIELASAWVRALSCEEIATEIERSLDILATSARNIEPRHRNMRAALEHSWNLLTDEERDVFKKLSVFRGGFRKEAALAVAGASLPTLSALVDKSLLRVNANGRYDIHELLRQYGEEQVTMSGDTNTTRDAHSAYYMGYLAQREHDLKGRRQLAALNEIEADFENIRVAWRWALSRKHYHLLDLALETLFHFCEMQARFQDGEALLWTAHEQLAAEPAEELGAIRERIRVRGIWMMEWHNRDGIGVEAIRDAIEASVKLARQQGDPAHLAFCLWLLGALGHLTRDQARVVPFLEESLALFTSLGDRFYMARAADWLGAVVGTNGQVEEFIRLSQQSLDLRRALGDRFGMAASLVNLGQGALEAGQYDQAKRYSQEMGQIYLEIGTKLWINRPSILLCCCAGLLSSRGIFKRLARGLKKSWNLPRKGGVHPF